MPGAESRLLAVDRDRPDGAPVALRDDDLPLDPDLGDEDIEDDVVRPPSPFIRLLCENDAKGEEPERPEKPPNPSPEYKKLGFG